MAHIVTFEDFGGFQLLSQQDVIDLIDLFYRWGDARFHVIGHDKHPNRRGSHIYNGMTRTHVITLSRNNIEDGVRSAGRMGGNTKAPDSRAGAAMVLAHELQHANQSQLHTHNEVFYTVKRYNRRPCERDARSFVDDNMDVIMDFLGRERPVAVKRASAMESLVNPVGEVTDLLGECEEVSVEDIGDELRRMGANNPKNVLSVKKALSDRGVRILTPC